MPYHVCTRSGAGALGVIVETDFLEGGHREVTFKDLLGNEMDRAMIVAMAEIEE
jgi:hypothetical protein